MPMIGRLEGHNAWQPRRIGKWEERDGAIATLDERQREECDSERDKLQGRNHA